MEHRTKIIHNGKTGIWISYLAGTNTMCLILYDNDKQVKEVRISEVKRVKI